MKHPNLKLKLNQSETEFLNQIIYQIVSLPISTTDNALFGAQLVLTEFYNSKMADLEFSKEINKFSLKPAIAWALHTSLEKFKPANDYLAHVVRVIYIQIDKYLLDCSPLFPETEGNELLLTHKTEGHGKNYIG